MYMYVYVCVYIYIYIYIQHNILWLAPVGRSGAGAAEGREAESREDCGAGLAVTVDVFYVVCLLLLFIVCYAHFVCFLLLFVFVADASRRVSTHSSFSSNARWYRHAVLTLSTTETGMRGQSTWTAHSQRQTAP